MTGSLAERARSAVTKSLRAAVRRIEESLPALGAELERRVKTGTFCVYVPDLVCPRDWVV